MENGEQQGQASEMESVDLGSGQASEKFPQANSQRYAPAPGTIPVALPEHEDLHTYVQRARNISLFSIVFTLCCAGVGLGFAWKTSSSALLGYGLEALVDVWSSVLVLWRFWNDPDGEGQYFLVTRRREQRASVGIAVTFILIGFFTCWQASYRLIEETRPKNEEILLAISGTSVIILSWSCAMKFSLAKVLKSSAMRKDAITSGAVASMAATMLVSTTIFKSHPNIWWIDAAVALIVSFVLSVLGVHTLMKNPWWRKDFWVDGSLPPEEKQATHIMELPFHGSPKKQDLSHDPYKDVEAASDPDASGGAATAVPEST